MWQPLKAEEDESEFESCRRRYGKKSCCAFLCVLGCPVSAIVLWLIAALLVGTSGHAKFKYPFSGLAPLKSMPIKNVSGAGPLILGTAPLAVRLRGLFWLSEQGKSSALVSFGGPNKDLVADGGSPCSIGDASKVFCVRVSGDRTWSMMSDTMSWISSLHDFRYIFTLDNVENPTYITIDPYADWGGHLPGYNIFFFASFVMKLYENGHPEYNGSVVWERGSSSLGKYKKYDSIQVMDESGQKLEPAWSKFSEHAEKYGGVIWYHSYE